MYKLILWICVFISLQYILKVEFMDNMVSSSLTFLKKLPLFSIGAITFMHDTKLVCRNENIPKH